MGWLSDIKDSLFGSSSSSSGNDSVSAAFVNGLFNIGSGILGNYFNKKENKRAFERNLSMWEMENDYNHPANQMVRLKMAGLNPNLVYGSGATTLAASTKAAQSANVSFPQLDILSSMNAYQDLKQKDAMTENIKAQAMKSMADALVAIKDYDTYSKTGAHPNRQVGQQATNIILNGLLKYAEPVTNWVGDKITEFETKPLKTGIFGNELR